jgi:hypothetical protein
MNAVGRLIDVGMTIRVWVPDKYGYGDDFLPTGDTHTRSELRQVRDGYFFLHVITRRVPDTLLPL